METQNAPYAPPSSVLAVIKHYRSRDVPERITSTNLMQLGVTEALTPRTMVALKFLGLVREDGTTTDQFKALRYANDTEYKEVFTAMLNSAYKDVLDHLDIDTASERDLSNAFIPYSPGGQRDRMITLFLALAWEAGWTTSIPARNSASRPSTATSKPVPRTRIEGRKAGAPVKSRGEPSRTQLAGDQMTGNFPIAFGVTAEDMAALDDKDFDEVWAALGKLAKGKAHALRRLAREDGGIPREQPE